MNYCTSYDEDLDLSDFEWYLPSPKEVAYSITIPNDTCFNINQRLISQISNKITIGIYKSNPNTLCIKIEPDKGFSIPKSGTIKDKGLIYAIKSRGINLPAHYSVSSKGEYWIATLNPPAIPPNPPKKIPSKPRSKGLNVMLTSGGHL